MTVKQIYDFMQAWAPFETTMDGDNAGLLVGDEAAEVTTVGICLDITEHTLLQAKKEGCELIISHHPVIFAPMKSILAKSVPYLLACGGISAICAHTNLDAAGGGVNDTLASLLGLQDIRTLADPRYPHLPPIARMGMLKTEMNPEEFACLIKERLNPSTVKIKAGSKPIKTVGICGGAGGDLIGPAFQNGADAFVSSDIRHHEWLSVDQQKTLVDAGHFATEHGVVHAIDTKLSDAFPCVKCIILEEKEPYLCY